MSETRYLLLYEGSAEKAICDILIENDLLHFSKKQMLYDDGVKGLTYEKIRPLLNFSMQVDGIKNIRIYRIKDKKDISFKIGPVHKELLKGPVDILTRPEIEMLYIISKNKLADYSKFYTRNKMKPSVYVKDILHCKEIKNYGFVYKYFSDIGLLLKTINTYHKSKKDEITLWNILKSNYDEKIIWK